MKPPRDCVVPNAALWDRLLAEKREQAARRQRSKLIRHKLLLARRAELRERGLHLYLKGHVM
jgi:hypothetical protein